jgi:hypothetical protein
VAWIVHTCPFQASANESAPAGLSKKPTAVQEAAVLHDTPSRTLPVVVAALGVVWRAHAVPFHASASEKRSELPSKLPTAVQATAELHDTLLRVLAMAPAGLGVDCSFQTVPFHLSANVTSEEEALLKDDPTAIHAVAELHETPASFVTIAPAGSGVACTVQAVPFHTSARGTSFLTVLVNHPAAVQAVAEVHDTPLRTLW